jgi:hypothetical protein
MKWGGRQGKEDEAMVKANVVAWSSTDALVAELASAAYRVALRHGIRGAFIDVELDLWRELRRTLGAHHPPVLPLECGEADGFEEEV